MIHILKRINLFDKIYNKNLYEGLKVSYAKNPFFLLKKKIFFIGEDFLL